MTSPSAWAANCVRGDYASYSQDYARTTDVSGTCGTLGARHQYDPVWSSNNYWTNWYYSGGSAVQTPSTAELFASRHSGS